MPDILIVKSTAFLSHEKMQAVLDNLKEQKETGVILLPPYLEAKIVPFAMPDILVVKSTSFLPHEKMQAVLDNLKEQKETGVILLPPYLEAKIVPGDIKIKLIDRNGECVLVPSEDF